MTTDWRFRSTQRLILPRLDHGCSAIPVHIPEAFCGNCQVNLKIYVEARRTKRRRASLKEKKEAAGVQAWGSSLAVPAGTETVMWVQANRSEEPETAPGNRPRTARSVDFWRAYPSNSMWKGKYCQQITSNQVDEYMWKKWASLARSYLRQRLFRDGLYT